MSAEGRWNLQLAEERRRQLEAARNRRREEAQREQELAALCRRLRTLADGVEDAEALLAAATILSEADALAREVERPNADELDAAVERAREGLAASEEQLAAVSSDVLAWREEEAARAAQVRRLEVELGAVASEIAGADTVAVAQEAIARLQQTAGAAGGDEIADAEAAVARATALADEADERRATAEAVIQALLAVGFRPMRRERVDGDGMKSTELLGRMPSGRTARFVVRADGETKFDLDGYVGTACKDELDGLGALLTQRFGVEHTPPQFEWKNPDRISRGALDRPGPNPGAKSRRKA